ncbi:MAG: T9SS type A sorting domain-containing protein [Bacteroidetes bacterium]|nr:T9SS type A sorting domain-containing protein [Bacteroidota bacterium]
MIKQIWTVTIYRTLAICILCLLYLPSTAQQWQSIGSGLNGEVKSMVVNPAGDKLYIAGKFTVADGVSVRNIVCWDGSNMIALNGLESDSLNNLDQIDGIIYFNGDLYAIGTIFLSSDTNWYYIAKWDGTNWSGIPKASFALGMDANAYAMSVHNSKLYFGGWFTTIDGQTMNNVASWDGTNWAPVGNGTFGQISALSSYNSELYAGGFSLLGSEFIVKWNGTKWDTVGASSGGPVMAFQEYDSKLYVSTNIGLGILSSSSWTFPATGFGNGVILDFAMLNGDLYVGGAIPQAAGTTVNNVAKWNLTSWDSLSSGMDDRVNAVVNFNGELYAGGDFLTAGGDSIMHIAKWEAPSWINPSLFNNQQQVIVYPNPASDLVTLNIELGHPSNIFFELYNVHGEKVRSFTSSQKFVGFFSVTLDVASLPSGIYYHTLLTGEHSLTGKLVIIR